MSPADPSPSSPGTGAGVTSAETLSPVVSESSLPSTFPHRAGPGPPLASLVWFPRGHSSSLAWLSPACPLRPISRGLCSGKWSPLPQSTFPSPLRYSVRKGSAISAAPQPGRGCGPEEMDGWTDEWASEGKGQAQCEGQQAAGAGSQRVGGWASGHSGFQRLWRRQWVGAALGTRNSSSPGSATVYRPPPRVTEVVQEAGRGGRARPHHPCEW